MQESLKLWIDRITAELEGKDKTYAYWFGILELVDGGYALSLSAGKEYDEDDDDWSCDIEPVNEDHMLDLTEYTKEKEWDIVQDEVTAALQAYVKSDSFKNSFLSSAIAITTGFAGGDLVTIKL